MDLQARLTALRTGFTRTLWVANVIELFERFAYYGSKAILAVYVAEQVGLGPEAAGWLVGSVFNTLLYFLPVLAGTVVDRFGFKRSLQTCFAIFCVGYLLIGLGGLPAGQPLVQALGLKAYMIVALVVTAVGGSLIKPSIVGTVAAHDRLRDQGPGLLDLLHAGQHRRRPAPSGTSPSGSTTGSCSSGTGTTPQLAQWINGIGQPQ